MHPAFRHRPAYPVRAIGGLWDDITDAASSAGRGIVAQIYPDDAVAGRQLSMADRQLSEEQRQGAINNYIVRNAIDSGSAAAATGAKVGPPKSATRTATTATAPAVKPAPAPVATLGPNLALVGGGAAALVGALLAYRAGHTAAGAALGLAGVGALGWGVVGGAR